MIGKTNTKVKVIDAICGAGKTSWAIQMINDSENVNGFGERPDKRYFYVTPFLNEVSRVSNSTKARFFEPDAQKGRGSKIEHLKMLVELGESIVTTHELFKRLDLDTLEDIEASGYTLIMDEVANVLEPITISQEDIGYLLTVNAIQIDELGKVTWLDDCYGKEGSRFKDIKIMADNENLYILGEKAFYWTLNVKAFEVFEEVYILTYLFDAQMQKYYYDMFNVEYSKHSVIKDGDQYALIAYTPSLEPREALYDLLNIYEDSQNEIGRKSTLNSNYDSRQNLRRDQKHYQLSSRWFKKTTTEEDIKQLQNNLNNYFSKICPTSNDKLFWTTIKEFAPILKNPKCKFNKKNDRTKDNFVSFNARATNYYADRTSMAYVYNRFMNPNDKQFFTLRNVAVDEDLLAISDLIQFIFRGCIRNGKPMNCYIPSKRMRNLLKQWAEFNI